MDVTNEDEARAWLRAWNGSPPTGILAAAIEGVGVAVMVLPDGPTRRDAQAALKVLEGKRTKTRPHPG
tara:strand:+ start:729 stop:932 length:204 start_codon:yes stop_codon:yes gene_type:complete